MKQFCASANRRGQMAGRGGTGVVVDLSYRRLESLHLHSTAPNKLAAGSHAMLFHSGHPRSFVEEVEVPRSTSGPTCPPVISPSGVRCLILKDNRLTFLPSALFVPDDEDDGLDEFHPSSGPPGCLEGKSADDRRPGSVLRIVDAANNRLTRLPSSIGYATSLTVLNLTANRISSLPPEIGRFVLALHRS